MLKLQENSFLHLRWEGNWHQIKTDINIKMVIGKDVM
jgi:hypothetical protein